MLDMMCTILLILKHAKATGKIRAHLNENIIKKSCFLLLLLDYTKDDIYASNDQKGIVDNLSKYN